MEQEPFPEVAGVHVKLSVRRFRLEWDSGPAIWECSQGCSNVE